MINVCLCDDSEETLREYSEMITRIAETHQFLISLSAFHSGEQLLFKAEDTASSIDILYLDMLMGKLNGIQTAKRLRALGFEGKIIFLTSSKDHALESFDVEPLHYIVKQDTSPEKFEEVFVKAVSLTRDFQKESFVFENKNLLTRILLEDIYYFEAQRRQVELSTKCQTYTFYHQIDQVEEQLSAKGFARCHRSFVVNLHYIRGLSAVALTLSNGVTLPVGSKYLKDLKYCFSKYLESHSVII